MSFRVMYNVILFLGFLITQFFQDSTFFAAGIELCCRVQWRMQDWLAITPRPSSVSVSEFGAVGDGRTLSTVTFQNAIFYLKSFVDKGGAQLYVPEGRWLIGCINLTSHHTLFLEKDTVNLGSQDYSHWSVVGPMPSYGGDLEVPSRYRGLITGQNLTDVVITGVDAKSCNFRFFQAYLH